MSYKEAKKKELRELVKKNMYASAVAKQAGNSELAKQYWKIATAYSDQLVKLNMSNKTSFQLKREDKQSAYQFQQLYSGAVELFA